VNGRTLGGEQWSPHLKGHLLQFEPAVWPVHTYATGLRLLVVAASLEILRLVAVRLLYATVPLWVLTPLLLAVGVASVPTVAGVPLSHLGFRRWRSWSATEKSYFLQVVIAAAVFVLVLLGAPPARGSGEPRSLWGVFVPYLFFGFYQELVYRGMVQLALVRRWGAPAGILAANVLYTFGPLHTSYFAAGPSVAVPMFASIFLIGLFFGVLYRRSGNLWIVGCFHAIGNAVIVWRIGSIA